MAVQQIQNQEIKINADIEARNKNKAAVRGNNTDQKIKEVLENPAELKKIENNWKEKTFGQPGRVAVQSAFDDKKSYPAATNDKIQEIMRQIKGQ
jgi:hypothetical protein